MADFSGMIEQERVRAGSTFTIETVTGTAAESASSGATDLDPAPGGTVYDGLKLTVPTTYVGAKGDYFPAIDDPELSRNPGGLIARDDHVLECAPGLDLQDGATRRVNVILPDGRRFKALNPDVYTFHDADTHQRVLLRLAERGAPAAGP